MLHVYAGHRAVTAPLFKRQKEKRERRSKLSELKECLRTLPGESKVVLAILDWYWAVFDLGKIVAEDVLDMEYQKRREE